MGKKYDLLTIMDLCVDFLIRMGEVTPKFGQKEQLIGDYEIELGGSSSIFASQAVKLGLSVAGVGAVGDDFFGRFVLEKLGGTGIDLGYIRVDRSLKTGMGAALCKGNGDRSILTYTGSIDAASPEDITGELLAATRHLHIGSYYLLKKLRPHFPDIAGRLKTHGGTLSLDTNWDPDETWDGGIWDLLPYVDVFLPNENELRLISGRANPEEAVAVLLQTVPVVALKLGPQGAAVYTREECRHEPALEIPVVDTVGAGDNFDAGFIYGYLSGYSLQKCLKTGCICGSRSAAKAGGIAGQPARGEIEQYFS